MAVLWSGVEQKPLSPEQQSVWERIATAYFAKRGDTQEAANELQELRNIYGYTAPEYSHSFTMSYGKALIEKALNNNAAPLTEVRNQMRQLVTEKQQRAIAPRQDPKFVGAVLEPLNSFTRAALTSPAKAIGGVQELITGERPEWQTKYEHEIGQMIPASGKEGFISGTVPEFLGSSVPDILIGGAAGKLIKAIPSISRGLKGYETASKAVDAAGKATRAARKAQLAVRAVEQAPIAGIIGAKAGGQAVEEAKAAGASKGQAQLTGLTTAATQAAIADLMPMGSGKPATRIGQLFKPTELLKAGWTGTKFGAAGRLADNVIAASSFDPERKLTDGVAESALHNAGLMMIAHPLFGMMNLKKGGEPVEGKLTGDAAKLNTNQATSGAKAYSDLLSNLKELETSRDALAPELQRDYDRRQAVVMSAMAAKEGAQKALEEAIANNAPYRDLKKLQNEVDRLRGEVDKHASKVPSLARLNALDDQIAALRNDIIKHPDNPERVNEVASLEEQRISLSQQVADEFRAQVEKSHDEATHAADRALLDEEIASTGQQLDIPITQQERLLPEQGTSPRQMAASEKLRTNVYEPGEIPGGVETAPVVTPAVETAPVPTVEQATPKTTGTGMYKPRVEKSDNSLNNYNGRKKVMFDAGGYDIFPEGFVPNRIIEPFRGSGLLSRVLSKMFGGVPIITNELDNTVNGYHRTVTDNIAGFEGYKDKVSARMKSGLKAVIDAHIANPKDPELVAKSAVKLWKKILSDFEKSGDVGKAWVTALKSSTLSIRSGSQKFISKGNNEILISDKYIDDVIDTLINEAREVGEFNRKYVKESHEKDAAIFLKEQKPGAGDVVPLDPPYSPKPGGKPPRGYKHVISDGLH